MSKISELSDGGSIQSGDTLIAVRSGGNVKVTYGGTTTANIDGGTIDGTVIGGSSAAAGSFTTISASGEIAANGGVAFGDNDKATFGASDDLQIYHNGSNSFITDTGTGDLYIRSSSTYIQDATNASMIDAVAGGAVNLYYDKTTYATAKLSTTSTGIDVTGTVTADGLTVDGGSSEIKFSETASSNASLVLQDATERLSKIQLDITSPNVSTDYYAQGKSGGWYGRHRFYTSANNTTAVNRMEIGSNGDISFYDSAGSSQSFYWDASAESLELGTSASMTPTASLAINEVVGGTPAIEIIPTTDATSDITASIRLWGTVYGTANRHSEICNITDGSTASNELAFKTNGSERMRIDSSGNLLVGKTTSAFATNGCEFFNSGTIYATRTDSNPMLLHRLGTDGSLIDFYNDSSACGSISCSGTTTAYNTSSDQRLKENITDADDAGSKIDSIQVRQFDWKADGSHQDYGMIAQELMTVAPEAVSGDPESDEMMGVDYSKLVPMLIKEIQSLRARVAQLEN